MNAATLIQLALSLTQLVLAQVKTSGVAPEVIADVEAAVAALAKVHDTDVTYQQLEDLRTKKLW